MHRRLLLIAALAPTLAAGAIAQPESDPLPAARAETVPLPDYAKQYHDYARSLQPDGANGWDLFVQIAELHDEIAERHYDPDYGYHEQGMVDYRLVWDPDRLADDYTIESQLSRIHAQIEDARESGLLELLTQLAACDHLIQPLADEPLLKLPLPQFGWSRSIARLNLARMTQSAIVQDHEQFLAALDQNLWLSRTVSSSAPTLIGNLVGRAIDATTLRRLRGMLLDKHVSSSLALQSLRSIDSTRPIPTLQQALEGERLFRLDTYSRVYNEDGHITPHGLDLLGPGAAGQAESDSPSTEQGGATTEALSAVMALDAKLHADLVAIVTAPPNKRPRLVDELDAHEQNLLPVTKEAQASLLISMLTPTVSRPAEDRDLYHLELAATRIMLAIEVYRAREGRLPAQLTDLTPDILRELPDDPFTRAPLHYSPDVASPLGYRLYSAGYDETDNGGVSSYVPNSPASERLALRAVGEGADYPIVPPPTD